MPRPTADRDALYDALTPIQRMALAEAIAAFGVDPERWHEAPVLAGFFELVAFAHAVQVLEAGGATKEEARGLVGIKLGLNEEAAERRIRRQRARTKRPGSSGRQGVRVEVSPTHPDPGDLP